MKTIPGLRKATLFVIALLAFVIASALSQEISSPPLVNGIYAVLGDDSTLTAARVIGKPGQILVYDGKYVDSTQAEAPRYVTVDTSIFVPLVLAEAPAATRDGRGHTLLNVALSKKYAARLEEFSRAHLGGMVAIVLGGEVITMHKVRSVVEGGKLQITRCYDNACEVLRAKLLE